MVMDMGFGLPVCFWEQSSLRPTTALDSMILLKQRENIGFVCILLNRISVCECNEVI